MVIQQSFFDCPTVSVRPTTNSNNIENDESNNLPSSSWTPPPAIPSGFELAPKSKQHQYKMITFALGKIFCYSCIGNITTCINDELALMIENNDSSLRKIQPVAVAATRVPMDVLSVVVDCGEDYDPDSSSSASSILIRHELWTLADRIIEVVTGPKCGEKLCCLLDNHPLAPPLSSIASSSYHFLVENISHQQQTSRNRQRSFLVFESDEAKEALELIEQVLEEQKKKREEEHEENLRNKIKIEAKKNEVTTMAPPKSHQQQQHQTGRKLE